MLPAPLAAVALSAQHLAVINYCATAFAPRGDVVALHKLDVKLLAAQLAAMLLLLIDSELDVFGE